MTSSASVPVWALFIRADRDSAFEISDRLGFEVETEALAVSIFEDGPDTMAVQAIFETETDAKMCHDLLNLPETIESFVTQLPDEDWVSLSQSGLPPVRAGRFFIYGSHDADQIPNDIEYPILIEAGMAFGTGHHGTTKGCLLMLDDMVTRGDTPQRILDLGCGAGILAIAAAKAYQRTVLATDIDPDAKEVTNENAKINGVAEFIDAHVADGFDSPVLKGQQFDLIFANILAGPLMGLAPEIANALAPNGQVILSGILDELAPDVAVAFEDVGINVTPQPSLAGWTSLRGIKKPN